MLSLILLFDISFPNITIGGVSMLALVLFVLKNPDTVEKWVALINRLLSFFYKGADKYVVKYGVQSKINSYITALKKKTPNLEAERVNIKWVDENITPESFINDGKVVLRMHKSSNEGKNVANATLAYVSTAFIPKIKYHLTPQQTDALNLYVAKDILEHANCYGYLQAFAEGHLRERLADKKANLYFSYFFDMGRAGVFYPIFVTELSFMGDKYYAHPKSDKIRKEVEELVKHLHLYSIRKTSDYTHTDYDGQYCKFAIRIVGKQKKIENQGVEVYVKSLTYLPKNVETVYILGDYSSKGFINEVVSRFLKTSSLKNISNRRFSSKIKGRDGVEFDADTYLVTLHNQSPEIYVR